MQRSCSCGGQVVLEARPNEYYFEPTCVSCLACFDANGLWRGDALKNYTCDATGNCTKVYATGCPEFCRGYNGGVPARVGEEMRDGAIRRWEATAPHHVAIFSGGFVGENCSTGGTGSGDHGCATAQHADIASTPPWTPGGGQYTGFFVAPRAANYTFFGMFDTGAELWLSPNGDPRQAKLVLGGEATAAPIDGDEIDGYTRWSGSWRGHSH